MFKIIGFKVAKSIDLNFLVSTTYLTYVNNLFFLLHKFKLIAQQARMYF